ncbi:Hypothetical predicted protein [Mytilus galloprovincialis]|uniref:Uncharacterized protein n=2 Tax=Mytilus galloprovincialis TaxID=29158 RepID=A0A8B6BJY9_MYTGA|nr:Hypothetical predicted protein [Mytilus galloprovincialis]
MTSLLLLTGTGVAATLILVLIVLIMNRRRPKSNVPPGVVVLYQIGRGNFAPSISPFPLKLETFLRMTKIPYMNDHSGKFSSKGKTPWMEYNGKPIADSQFCIEYLKKEKEVDVNTHLDKDEISIAKAFQRLTEENLYWTMCIESFGGDVSAVSSIIPYTGLKLWLTVKFLQRVIKQETWGHGMGRHTPDEVWEIAVHDMTAISNFLGVKKFFMGDEPCEVDCVLFGMLVMIIYNMPGSKHQKFVTEALGNLVSYCERMKNKYWPDWNDKLLPSPTYKDDSDKIYWHKTDNSTHS